MQCIDLMHPRSFYQDGYLKPAPPAISPNTAPPTPSGVPTEPSPHSAPCSSRHPWQRTYLEPLCRGPDLPEPLPQLLLQQVTQRRVRGVYRPGGLRGRPDIGPCYGPGGTSSSGSRHGSWSFPRFRPSSSLGSSSDPSSRAGFGTGFGFVTRFRAGRGQPSRDGRARILR